MRISLIIVTVFVLTSTVAYAQESKTPVLNSNRIGFTESSRTVMKGGFLLESGFTFRYSKFNLNHDTSLTFETIVLPRLRLSYGITKFMEIQVEGNYMKSYYKTNTNYGNSFEQSTFSLGLKFNLSKQKGMLPQTALVISERAYFRSNHPGVQFKTTANLAWSYRLGKHFDLSGNILYSYSNEISNDIGLGLRLSYQFNERFGMFAELYVFDEFTTISLINIGAWYKVTPRFLVSLNVGTNMVTKNDWTHKNSKYNITLGVSFLLNNPNKKMNKKKSKKRKLRTY